MNFQLPPKISAALLPTPIEKPAGLNSHLTGGQQIFIKRDDLTGNELSGNKIRKLEFLATEFLQQGADTLITCGGIQSNHCRATAFLARKLGLNVHLVLRGNPADSQSGNLFLNQLIKADITWVTPEQYKNERHDIMQGIADELTSQGRKGYIIPVGASNALGSMGYLNAIHEIKTQLTAMQQPIDLIVTAIGSGGTYAGLLLGKFLYELDCDVVGINVCGDAASFKIDIFDLIQDFRERFNFELEIPQNAIKIIDGYVGRGYAQSRPEELELLQKIAVENGLVLDPVYTGKAMFGLLNELENGALKKYQNILFIHTGGLFGLFPKENEFNFS